MTITAPAALARVSAPLPEPRRFTLLDAARLVEDGNDRWLAGVFVEAYPGGQPSTFDPCSSGSARVKAIDGSFASPMFGGFTVYFAAVCTGASVAGSDARTAEFRQRLQASFRAKEGAAVERFMVGGDGLTLAPYLGDTNLDILGAGAVSVTEGLALLENAIGASGNGLGIIHVTPAIAAALSGRNLIYTARDGKKRTAGNDTLVAVGAGYIGADPDSGASPSGDQEWAFASDLVEYRRGEDFVVPERVGQALDRSTNDVTFIIERNYLLSWVGRQDGSDDDHTQAGVLIDRSA